MKKTMNSKMTTNYSKITNLKKSNLKKSMNSINYLMIMNSKMKTSN